MSTPARLIVPLPVFVGKRTEHPRIRSALRAIVVTSAVLLLAAFIPLARSVLTDIVIVLIALTTAVLMERFKVGTLWIILDVALLNYVLSVTPLFV